MSKLSICLDLDSSESGIMKFVVVKKVPPYPDEGGLEDSILWAFGEDLVDVGSMDIPDHILSTGSFYAWFKRAPFEVGQILIVDDSLRTVAPPFWRLDKFNVEFEIFDKLEDAIIYSELLSGFKPEVERQISEGADREWKGNTKALLEDYLKFLLADVEGDKIGPTQAASVLLQLLELVLGRRCSTLTLDR